MKNIIIFVIATIALVVLLSLVYYFSEPKLQSAMQDKQARAAKAVLAKQEYDRVQNFELFAPRYLKQNDTQIAQRIYKGDEPQVIVLSVLTDYAYAGRIGLLVAFNKQCEIEGVEVVQSKETPGLGDQYKKDGGSWLSAFRGKSLANAKWQLKKQGGDFDAWTGATVSPKAIVAATADVLELCEAHHSELFSKREIVYFEL